MTTDLNEPITAEEGETIQLFVASLGLLGEEAAVQLARVTGSAMAKVAETLVGGFRIQFEIPRLESGVRYIDVVKEYSDIIALAPPGVRPQSRCAAAAADPGRGEADVVDRRGAFHRDLVAYRRIRRPGRLHRSDRFPLGPGAGGRAHRLRRAHRPGGAAGERPGGQDDRRRGHVRHGGRRRRLPDRSGPGGCLRRKPDTSGPRRAGHRGDGFGVRRSLRARCQPRRSPRRGRPSPRRWWSLDERRTAPPASSSTLFPPRPLKGFPDAITPFQLVSPHGAT